MKKIILTAVIFFVGLCPIASAQNQVTLTTYYPAPFGMYQEMRVMGRLGVGTTNPNMGDKVHVVSDDPAKPLYITAEHTNNQDVYLYLKPPGQKSSVIQFGTGGTSGLIRFDFPGQFNINRNVNVGAMGGVPAGLSVYNNTLGGTITNTSAADYGLRVYQGTDPVSYANMGHGGIFIDAQGKAAYGIYQRSGEKNYFASKIGVGTTDPYFLLDIEGNPSTASNTPTTALYAQAGDGTTWAARVQRTSTSIGKANIVERGSLHVSAPPDSFGIYQPQGGYNYFAGNVGIGTTNLNTPLTTKLVVQGGDIRIQDGGYATLICNATNEGTIKYAPQGFDMGGQSFSPGFYGCVHVNGSVYLWKLFHNMLPTGP